MPAPGNGHPVVFPTSQPPRRVVSLVPSLTESFFDLGLGSYIVGITDYCTYPHDALEGLPRLGGPKNPRINEITALQPDLVLVNQEENSPQAIRALDAAGVKVWMSFPKTIREALDLLWTIVGVYQSTAAAIKLETLELTVEWAKTAAEGKPAVRYFCPIWSDATGEGMPWWMTFNRETYCHDVLTLMGGENVFAARQRRYPLAADLGEIEPEQAGDRDTRYPRISQTEIVEKNPQVILLPSEPYPYDEAYQEAILSLLPETDAVRSGKVFLVDGSLITWHGTRLARALQELPQLFAGDEAYG